MLIHIFKTDLSKDRVEAFRPVFDALTQVTKWTVDTEDIDRVLRIESLESLKEQDVMQLSKMFGFRCEPLD